MDARKMLGNRPAPELKLTQIDVGETFNDARIVARVFQAALNSFGGSTMQPE